MTSRIEKILPWSILVALLVVAGIGRVLEQQDASSSTPCPALAAELGGFGDLEQARAELQRRRSAHERALTQLRADPLWEDPELQPWLVGAVADEESIIDELEAAEAGLDESCLDAN